MKIENGVPKFNPVTITLESPEELAMLFAIFNHASITSAFMCTVDDFEIRNSLTKTTGFSVSLAEEYFKKLNDCVAVRRP